MQRARIPLERASLFTLLALPAHRGAVIGLAMDDAGRILYTSGTDGDVRAWSGR